MGTIISMWFYNKLGMDIYYFLNCFFLYSFLGWIFESIVISYEEKSPVNRGFIRGPFCTIYGAGALGVYYLFQPIAQNKLLLFILGAIVASIFEYLVAQLMLRIFGEFWWDYNEKPFNYKGILCLESTVCWGVMTLLLFLFLQPAIEKLVNTYYSSYGKVTAIVILVVYCLDFSTSFYKAYEAKLERNESPEIENIPVEESSEFEYIAK